MPLTLFFKITGFLKNPKVLACFIAGLLAIGLLIMQLRVSYKDRKISELTSSVEKLNQAVLEQESVLQSQNSAIVKYQGSLKRISVVDTKAGGSLRDTTRFVESLPSQTSKSFLQKINKFLTCELQNFEDTNLDICSSFKNA